MAGFILGLSILARSIAILWVPGIALVVWFVGWRNRQQSSWQSVKAAFLLCVCSAVVISPWAVRNTLLLKTFAPMGTQGMMELSAGYSDEAYSNSGVWKNLRGTGFYDESALAGLHGYAGELEIAGQSKAKAFAWIGANFSKLPALAAMKVLNELRPGNIISVLVLLLAVIGIVVSIGSRNTLVLLGLLLANLTAVAVTWSVEGRFLVPQLFCFYVLAGIGVQACVTRFCPQVNHVEST